MNSFKKSMLTAAMVSTGVVGVTAGTAAQAEVSASVGVANIYFWRGFDLGGGSAAVSGSLDYGHESGFYAGIWGSSGDDSYGTEYDLYAGWGGNITEDLTFDISYWDYNYPDTYGTADLEEWSVGLGYGVFGYYAMIPTKKGTDPGDYGDYIYHNISADLGSGFSAAIGHWTGDSADGSHLDLTYTVSDVSFTISTSTGDSYSLEGDGVLQNDEVFVVAYSLPLDM